MRSWYRDPFHKFLLISCLIFSVILLHASASHLINPSQAQAKNDTQKSATPDSNQTDKIHKAKLLFFTAVWCEPCKKVKQVLSELPKEYTDLYELIAIDYDQSPLEVADFNIKELPTIILFDTESKFLIRVNGASKEGLDALISKIKSLKKSSRKHSCKKARYK